MRLTRKKLEILDKPWFEEHLRRIKNTAGVRYSPELNVELDIAQVFDGLGRTKEFFDRIKAQYGSAKRSWNRCQTKSEVPEAKNAYNQLNESANKLFKLLHSIDYKKLGLIKFNQIGSLADEVKGYAWQCAQKLRDIENHAKDDSSDKNESHRSESFNSELHHLYELASKAKQLFDFARSTQAASVNNPMLLLTGDSGTGKTHLLCDVAEHRIGKGLPTVVMFGEQFVAGNLWDQAIQILQLPYKSKEELLAVLNELGHRIGSRTLIFIDAINEGAGSSVWRDHITQMVADVKHFPFIGLAISIRNGFIESTISAEQKSLFVEQEHTGFTFKEWEAVTKFFKEFSLPLPEIPLLMPEFQNPLFLLLFCKAYQNRSKRKGSKKEIFRGHEGATYIFESFVKSVADRIAVQFKLPKGRDKHGNYVIWDTVIEKIAAEMIDRSDERIPEDKLVEIIREAYPTLDHKKFISSLESNSLLAKVPRYSGEEEKEREFDFRFTFQKFSDHLLGRYIFKKYKKEFGKIRNSLEAGKKFFSKRRKLGRFISSPGNIGIVKALSIQCPERLNGYELVDIAPYLKNSFIAQEAFIESLIWRRPTAFAANLKPTLDYINKKVARTEYGHYSLLNAFLSIAMIPEHPFNANFLHEHLSRFSMPKRDSWWSVFLHYQYGEKGAIDRLVDWAWTGGDKSHINDEALKLCGIALAWLFTSSNRFLRDRATKAMVSLFTDRLKVMILVLKQFNKINDPYVAERLYAVAYGAALRSLNSDGLKALAMTIYSQVFEKDRPPPHILLRDYARGVIELALYKNLKLNINEELIRPPYKSSWPRTIPSKEELTKKYYEIETKSNRDYRTIWFSVLGGGDFDRYVIGTNAWSFDWSSRRLGKKYPPLKRVIREQFIEELSSDQLKQYELLKKCPEMERRLAIDIELGHKTKLKIDPVRLKKEIEALEIAFKKSLNARQRKVYQDVVHPLDSEFGRVREYEFDITIPGRWIFQKVVDLGWTPELFARFDESISDRNRAPDKAERIGKKYQWIAYHEFLARVSDNFEFFEDRFEDRIGIYEGPWHPSVRDIDSSCLLGPKNKSTGDGDVRWWSPLQYDSWEAQVEDRIWLSAANDLPDPKPTIEVVGPDSEAWLVLDNFVRWEQETPAEHKKYDVPHRDLWYMIKSYIVKRKDLECFFDWAKDRSSLARLMNDSYEFHNVYLREYPWAQSYLTNNNPNHGRSEWVRDDFNNVPCEILTTSERCSAQPSGFDCSMDESIRILLPVKWIFDGMNLRPTEVDGAYSGDGGQLLAIDPSEGGLDGPGALVMKKAPLIEFLDKKNCAIVWTLLGEKMLIGGSMTRSAPGRLEISGAYTFIDGKLDGAMSAWFVDFRKS